jgi:hypothetical protein
MGARVKSIMPHHSSSMARVQNPANTFGEAITGVDDIVDLL